jgi:hypothetical protein
MLELSDTDIIAELRAYTRDDAMARDQDVRLTTRTSTCSSRARCGLREALARQHISQSNPATKRCTIVDQTPTVRTTIVDHGVFFTGQKPSRR